jgi:hypothetical protein
VLYATYLCNGTYQSCHSDLRTRKPEQMFSEHVLRKLSLYKALCHVQILGEGTLKFSSFSLEQLTRPEPHAARLRVRSPKGKSGGGGSVHLLVSYDANPPRLSTSSQPQPPPSTAQQNDAARGSGGVGGAGSTSHTQSKQNKQNIGGGNGNGKQPQNIQEEDGETDAGEESEGTASEARGAQGGGGDGRGGQDRNGERSLSQMSDVESASGESEGGYSKRSDLAMLTQARRSRRFSTFLVQCRGVFLSEHAQ